MTELKGCRSLLLGAALSFCTAIPGFGGEDLGFRFPDKSVVYPSEIAAGMSVPRWINGRLVSVWSRLQRGDTRSNVHVFGSDGRKIYEARVWPVDASHVSLLDIAVSLDGDVVVVGVADDRSGQPAYFFSRIAPSGVVSPAVSIEPFEGQRATFGPDGTLWILGWELDGARRFDPAADHATLRRFALDGRVLGEFLPWSVFGCAERQHPALDRSGGRPELFASRDRIVLLSGSCDQVVELTPDGEIVRRVSLPDGALPPFAAAITADNSVYIERPSHSICRLRLDDGGCEDIPGAEGYTLLGADGEALVVRNGAAIEWRTAVVE